MDVLFCLRLSTKCLMPVYYRDAAFGQASSPYLVKKIAHFLTLWLPSRIVICPVGANNSFSHEVVAWKAKG